MHGSGSHAKPPGELQLRYLFYKSLALGLSLSAHCGLALLFFFGEQVGSEPSRSTNADLSARLMVVDLAPKNISYMASMDVDEQAVRAPMPLVAPTLLPGPPQPESPKVDLPFLRAVRPHYFSVKELTQKPLVSRDVPADLMLIVPGVPPQAATLQILISEYGDVDKVIVEDSLLPDDAQKIVVDEFSKLKFNPGEINGTRVKSQLKIEILLEDAANQSKK
ncbi:tonB like protein [Janthinobacterium sp. Marseille]|nr:TonB-like protein [Janthinobacterium sp. Marseille]ABR91850.1 tonB like protein [Janthinobacterium sp. Marseille]